MYQKRNHNFLLKKSTAMVTASVMVIAAAVPAMADGMNYRDREKAGIKALGESLIENWDEGIAEAEEKGNNGRVEITLTLDEAGRSIGGILAGMDLSWLESAGLNMDVSIEDSTEAVAANLLLNNTELCTMNVLLDLLTETEYIQFPELTQSWIKAVMNIDVNGEAVSPESMESFRGVAANPQMLLPEASVVSEMLERYGNIVFDHMQEGASVEEAISIDGISEDCTLLEGQIFAEDAREMAKELLTAAQSDEQLADLLTKWSEAMPEAGDLNSQFQSYTEETLADLENPMEEEEEAESSAEQYFVSRIWVNGEDKVIGREFAVCEGIETDTSFTWKTSKNGDAFGLLLDVQSEGDSFTFTGSSKVTDGMKNGNYRVETEGITIMEIAMENYDVASAEEGYPSGTYTITFPEEESEEEYNPLNLFSMVVNLACNKEDDSTNVNVALLSSGAKIGDLNIHITYIDEAVEIVAEEDMGTVYDTMSEEDMNAYMEEMNFDTILANAKSAGVPDDLLTAIEQSIEAATAEPEEAESLEEAAGV